jgi:hypothetical protein
MVVIAARTEMHYGLTWATSMIVDPPIFLGTHFACFTRRRCGCPSFDVYRMLIAEGATEVRLGSDGRSLHRESRVRVTLGGASCVRR